MKQEIHWGDDASPQNLKEIVSDYADKMNIVYRRFDTNLGGVDLPGHWDRCIAPVSYTHLDVYKRQVLRNGLM